MYAYINLSIYAVIYYVGEVSLLLKFYMVATRIYLLYNYEIPVRRRIGNCNCRCIKIFFFTTKM